MVAYLKQDDLVQQQVRLLNEEFAGRLEIGDSHLEPFWDFPYLSVKVDDVQIFESKAEGAEPSLNVADIYVSVSLLDLLRGRYRVHHLLVEEGYCKVVLHEDGTNNLQNALSHKATDASVDTAQSVQRLAVALDQIELKNLDLHQIDEAAELDIETFIDYADGSFQLEDTLIVSKLDAKFVLNVIDGGDTTYLRHKHFDIHTDLSLNTETGRLLLKPSGITMEHGDFALEGTLDLYDSLTLDLKLQGTKPNFDMLIAFAPEDLIPVLEQYNNEGNIYFNAVVQGSVANGSLPFIDATFGASEAFLENVEEGKRLDDFQFRGHFTTGEGRSLATSEFSLVNVQAKMDQGSFLGALEVFNFEEPEVKMQVDTDFNLDFLAGFLNLENIEGASGRVSLHMKFHDIIDVDNPEKALNELDQAYYSELTVEDLSVTTDQLPAPLHDLDLHVIMDGHRAQIDHFRLALGESDLSIRGSLSDFPAILHHTDEPVEAHLYLSADRIDLAELSGFSAEDSTGIDEQIEDFRVGFSFVTSARAITESKYLPRGEFFIDSLHAQMKHYPHELHDFHADVLIDDEDLTIVDFTGELDDSDFHFNGRMHDYGFWMQPELNGDVALDITLTSNLLRLEDVFTYQGENYVPEEYRHEELDDLILHADAALHFRQSALASLDLNLDRVEAKMHLHPLRFEDFRGRIHYEDEHLVVEKFHGKLGHTVFDVDMDYYLGEDPAVRKRDNSLTLSANYIDFDELFSFSTNNPNEVPNDTATSTHEEAYNLYDLPFTDMTFSLDVDHFIYHRVDLQNIQARLRSTQNHYLYVDTLHLMAAGGDFDMSGYFNGSDPEHIYLKPNLRVRGADVDRLLFKFESHGEDEPLSENLHGNLTADITGNIRIYPDMVPNLDESEIHMDVMVLNGRLVNYEPMLMLTDYMGGKDLTNIRFDTLTNHMDLTNGLLTIPNMTIESTIGHFELAGKQDLDFNLEYYLRVPWNLVTQGTRNKLFGNGNVQPDSTGEDAIIKLDPKRKVHYLNLKIAGNLDDYSVTLGKEE